MNTTGYPVHRTAEQGHTAACLADALISAIQNIRDMVVEDCKRYGSDAATYADLDFRAHAQSGWFLQEADGYLRDGMTICKCPVEVLPEVTVEDDEDIDAAPSEYGSLWSNYPVGN